MVASPEWGINAGAQYLNGTENTSIIDAGMEALKHSQGYTSEIFPGYAFILGTSFIVLLVGIMIFTRTQKMYASVFGMLLTMYLLIYFNMFYHVLVWPLTAIFVLSIGAEVAIAWWQKD